MGRRQGGGKSKRLVEEAEAVRSSACIEPAAGHTLLATTSTASSPTCPHGSQLLRPQHTLLLLLLACWRQQEAVSPLDVARWALDGRLPYLSFPAEEGAVLLQYRTVLGQQLTTPTGAPPWRSR